MPGLPTNNRQGLNSDVFFYSLRTSFGKVFVGFFSGIVSNEQTASCVLTHSPSVRPWASTQQTGVNSACPVFHLVSEDTRGPTPPHPSLL